MVPLLRGASVVCLPESDVDGFFAALDSGELVSGRDAVAA